ncbi:hypothetical protein CK203_116192 [Vitis vinifera]|uniref:Uncharacterized protein n=1 Tax=Vitis vinifera TaxID=29760 RepID=A0A438FDN6_VITVI|nr:hypothetical protein CK203_116192 [Vitis vinifera]
MFPPADDPPDLGIPPNRGPLPVRRNPNSKPNPRVRSGHRRNARPQGIRGVRAHRGALWEILDGSHQPRPSARKENPNSKPHLAFVPAIDTMPGAGDSGGSSSPRHSIATNCPLSIENTLFRNNGDGADFVNILLKLPFTHSFMLTESNPPWRTKCLSDEADEVRIEAVISMLVIVLWSGLDVLFRRLEILLLWVLQLGIELLGFDLTVLDLCGLILV